MAKKLSLLAKSQGGFHVLEAAAIPPLPGARYSKPRERRLQVKNHRQAQFPTVVEETDRVGVVVAHAKFQFAEDPNPACGSRESTVVPGKIGRASCRERVEM